jgi:hypothetical protein
LADRSGKEKLSEKKIYTLSDFIEQTGFSYDPEREDDFMDYMQMLVRETMIIDQISTEIQYNRVGETVATRRTSRERRRSRRPLGRRSRTSSAGPFRKSFRNFHNTQNLDA